MKPTYFAPEERTEKARGMTDRQIHSPSLLAWILSHI